MRTWILAIAAALIAAVGAPSFGAAPSSFQIENRRSPWNRVRAQRAKTRYIVLHATESGGWSAVQKLRGNGEAHYLVDWEGQVFRIIDKNKVAKHAGLSLWEGHRGLDNYSIGIEVVGYHDGEFGAAQIAAL